MSAGELACTYATLILHDDGIPVTFREKTTDEFVKVTDEMKLFKAYGKLRLERTNKRHLGARLKRAADAEKEEK